MVPVEEVIKKYLYKRVKATTDNGVDFIGYLVGIKLPINLAICFWMVEDKHIAKYIKSFNPHWLEVIPNKMIETYTVLETDEEIEWKLSQELNKMFYK